MNRNRLLRTSVRHVIAVGLTCLVHQAALAQVTPLPEPQLFVAEIKVGPKWDKTKPAQDQLFFKEHSTNLRRLRESGALIMGARYSDKGLIILSAGSADEARAMLEPDPSFKEGVFAYELHPFNVFYSGNVQGRTRPPAK